MTRQPEEA